MKSGNFIFNETEIEGVYIVDVITHKDDRGYFTETYNERDFKTAGLNYTFVQDNQSSSYKGVLRGVHLQDKHPQAKLVRVLRGEVFDVAVDLRKGSKTYGCWVGVRLSGENRRQLMIPKGLAHGFLVMSDYAEFAFKCDEFYHPEDEVGFCWNDPDVAIDWPDVGQILLNDRDLNLPMLCECKIEIEVKK